MRQAKWDNHWDGSKGKGNYNRRWQEGWRRHLYDQKEWIVFGIGDKTIKEKPIKTGKFPFYFHSDKKTKLKKGFLKVEVKREKNKIIICEDDEGLHPIVYEKL